MKPRPGQWLAVAAALVSLAFGALPPDAALAAPPDAVAATAAAEPDMALGNPKAPVTVIEYASLGCPHCALWANEVFPAFKTKYIDTGKVRFVLREMLTGNGQMAAIGFLTARCAGPSHYFQLVEGLFAVQDQMAREGASALMAVAKGAGLSEDQVDACLQDKVAIAALEARSSRAVTVDKVTGTPTFVINGAQVLGEQSLAQLDAAIAAAHH